MDRKFKPHIYLSYGAGIVSEALRLWLIESKLEFESVWVDHGCDWPETREFALTIPNLTILKPNVEGFDNLYDYCIKYKFVPSFMNRWCTDKFKIRTLYKYFKRPCLVYIGYSYDEAHRMRNSLDKNIFNQFPLISMKWDRDKCISYIKKQKSKIPIRSGCWFCPYQKKEQWKLLEKLHPDLYERAKYLEKLNIEYRKKIGKKKLSLSCSGKELSNIVQEGQLSLFSPNLNPEEIL